MKKIDTSAYEKNLNRDVKLPQTKENIDFNDKTEYWPTSIKEIMNWLIYSFIIEFTSDRIDNDKMFLPPLLKMFSMFKIKFWWNPGEDEIRQTGVKISIRYSNG